MKNKIKISEVFKSIQGEGKNAGKPMFFIRTSGCTRNCWYCDTKYHIKGVDVKLSTLVHWIKNSKLQDVCWTGGEPLLWREQIEEIIKKTRSKNHHIETNGDLLVKSDFLLFNYLGISPKDEKTAEKIIQMQNEMNWAYEGDFDIKVVTDLKTVGKELIPYATMLMPLTVYNQKEDLKIQRKVWNWCVKHNFRFTPRYQFLIWGKKRSR